ncbi:MAG: NAD(P)/FAD-dependent oxidoreductase, partial [Pseudomonadota bacterium]
SEFAGDVLHSSQFRDAADYTGKNCVVVGSGNSAHDICAELWEQNANVTMVQRSSSLVVKIDTLAKGKVRALYSDEATRAGVTTERADMLLAASPYATMPPQQIEEYRAIAEREADFYQALKNAGFNYDFGDDGSGLYQKYLRYGAGYYIDVGASQLIIDGEIGIRSGVSADKFKTQSIVLSDGSELPADLVVFATGYGSMHGWAAQLISPEVADRVGPCWGLGSNTYRDPGPWEGELRNMWKPTAQTGLWFHGGNLQQSRHYSLYLTLQLKARFENIATSVYP